MALTRPRDGILALLSTGPMTTETLEARIEGAAALVDDMEMEGLIHRTPEGWAEGDGWTRVSVRALSVTGLY